MSKGDKQRGNREKKKPKQPKAKPAATAEAPYSKSGLVVAGKKVG